MAEERAGGWWDSWYKAAKDKSTEVLQFVKRDLDEFSTAVKSEASNVVSSTTSALKDKLRLNEPESTANTMKRSVSSFFGQVSSVLNPTPDDKDEEALVIHDSQPVVLTKFQMLQHALVKNPDTFLADPDKEHEKQYEAWLEILQDELTADRLSKLMAANPDLHSQYSSLVPDQVSHLEFWQRYLFRKALLEDEEARREALERRNEKERRAAENFQWDQENDFSSNIELTEEEQTRLLLEYEEECKKKRVLRSTSERDGSKDTVMACNVRDNHYSSLTCESKSEPSPATKVDSHPTNSYDNVTNKLDRLNKFGEKGEFNVAEPLSFKTKEKKDLLIVTDGNSCHTSSCSGDKESNDDVDDDWEREFDIEGTEVDTLSEQLAGTGKA